MKMWSPQLFHLNTVAVQTLLFRIRVLLDNNKKKVWRRAELCVYSCHIFLWDSWQVQYGTCPCPFRKDKVLLWQESSSLHLTVQWCIKETAWEDLNIDLGSLRGSVWLFLWWHGLVEQTVTAHVDRLLRPCLQLRVPWLLSVLHHNHPEVFTTPQMATEHLLTLPVTAWAICCTLLCATDSSWQSEAGCSMWWPIYENQATTWLQVLAQTCFLRPFVGESSLDWHHKYPLVFASDLGVPLFHSHQENHKTFLYSQAVEEAPFLKSYDQYKKFSHFSAC